MRQYLDLVYDVLRGGDLKRSRSGGDVLSLFGQQYAVDLAKGFPLLTTKKIHWKPMIQELLWYISGEPHIRNLQQHTKVWDPWADEDGFVPSAYGFFWRHFPDGTEEGIDQLQMIRDTLKTDCGSRRMVMTAWDPRNAHTSSLPPCHVMAIFSVSGDRLNCQLTQRSADLACGVSWNLPCYSALTMMLAQEAGLKPGTFVHCIADAHIYIGSDSDRTYDHRPGLEEQLRRCPRHLPTLTIADKPLDQLTIDDFEVHNYNPHPFIGFKAAV